MRNPARKSYESKLASVLQAASVYRPLHYRYPAPGAVREDSGQASKKVYASRRRAPDTTRQNLSGQISQNQSTVQVTPPGD